MKRQSAVLISTGSYPASKKMADEQSNVEELAGCLLAILKSIKWAAIVFALMVLLGMFLGD